VGQTPIVTHCYRWPKFSAISGVSTKGKLYIFVRAGTIATPQVLVFLRHLLRHLRGPVDLLWDRGSIHRRREVRAFLADHPRLHVHYFPAYAPELNPAEYVWAQADHELAMASRTISVNSALG